MLLQPISLQAAKQMECALKRIPNPWKFTFIYDEPKGLNSDVFNLSPLIADNIKCAIWGTALCVVQAIELNWSVPPLEVCVPECVFVCIVCASPWVKLAINNADCVSWFLLSCVISFQYYFYRGLFKMYTILAWVAIYNRNGKKAPDSNGHLRKALYRLIRCVCNGSRLSFF
jgi:hypothetical protein